MDLQLRGRRAVVTGSTAGGCAELATTVPDIDILVNNVGIFEPKPFEDIGDADWVRFFEMAASRGVDLATMEREFFEHARPSSLLRRFETPEEVAAMIVYLCSPLASGTNGAAVRVDGGVVRAIV